eukprot:30294-Pelagococcus_subviridis.AAC.36
MLTRLLPAVADTTRPLRRQTYVLAEKYLDGGGAQNVITSASEGPRRKTGEMPPENDGRA